MDFMMSRVFDARVSGYGTQARELHPEAVSL